MIERIKDYFEGMDEGDIERVMNAFHPDLIYKHPRAWEFEDNEPEYIGLENFKTQYLDKRGIRPFVHELVHIFAEDDYACVLGFSDIKGGYCWICHIRFKDGKIYRYIYGKCPGRPYPLD